jgi:cell division protein ZapE
MSETFSTRYAALVAAGKIEADPGQEALAKRLAALEQRLEQAMLARKSSSLGWLFGQQHGQQQKGSQVIRGLYVYGDVGRGKTLLMDLFFEASAVRAKRRVHFHEFMTEVHERIHVIRQQSNIGPDPIHQAAASIAEDAWLLCFDEFHVTDIADAMILGRLFTRLFELGVVMVATSNLAPSELYKDGLNRALFLPFIKDLEAHCEIARLEARVDFRLEKLTGMPTWYVPDDARAAAALDGAWRRLAGEAGGPLTLTVKGHAVRVPRAAMGVARFAFADLCGKPLGAGDYLRIAREFHTIILDHVPMLDYDRRNEAKRFIILIDTLYDQAVKLLASAASQPDRLYVASQGFEAQEFKRTASRLMEMRSQAYLGLPHGPRPDSAADAAGIVDA